jgi:hypothetical protein
MFKVVLRLFGLLLAVGGVVALWFAFEAIDEIRGQDNNIRTLTAQMEARRISRQRGEEGVAEAEQAIMIKSSQRDRWFATAVAALVLGVGAVCMPSSARKRKHPPVETAGEEGRGGVAEAGGP